MDAATKALVRNRAEDRCEYCLLGQEHDIATMHVEHIVARQHGGTDDPSNLALACIHCNLHKGPNLSGLDPETGSLMPLFNPRLDAWGEHFALQGGIIVGLTPVGRTTVYVLAMNEGFQIDLRIELLNRGAYP
jgi:hypothetical protein